MDETTTPLQCAVLFADVAGSTRLYERLGDRLAKDLIGQALDATVAIVRRHAGTLIKTIGDEAMCRFPSAEQAVLAAIDIQKLMADGLPGATQSLQMRMGLHWGAVIFEHGDVFGDAVNVAARMSAIARAGQIITTQETVLALPLVLADKTRQVDSTTVKGKQDALSIFEVVWESENLTQLVPVTSPVLEPVGDALHLEYQGFPLEFPIAGTLTIGRGETCDLYVNSPLASRMHSRIERRRGKFVYVDQSTNGSYIRTGDGSEVFLKREEFILRNHGMIALGEEVEPGNPFLIRYSLGEATIEIRALA